MNEKHLLPFERGFEYGVKHIFGRLRFFFSLMVAQLIILLGLALVLVPELSREAQTYLVLMIVALGIAAILPWIARTGE